MRSTKNVGGPTMNETLSCSIRSSATLGDHRSMSTAVIPEAPGDQHSVQQSGDVSQGSGHEHDISGRQPVHSRHQLRLVGERSVGVAHAFGLASRPGGEQHHRVVVGSSIAARVAGRPGREAANLVRGRERRMRARRLRAGSRVRRSRNGDATRRRSRPTANTRGRAGLSRPRCRAETQPRRRGAHLRREVRQPLAPRVRRRW